MVAVFKIMTLDMERIPESRRSSAKKAVLNVIENETTRALARGRSPVKGEIFPKLKEKYADDQKQGDRTPNLQLEGDMLEAIEYNVLTGDDVGWGYTNDNTQSDKADGHNQFSPESKKAIWDNGNPKLPKRRYIPDDGQDLKPSTMKLINEELDKFRTTNISTERSLSSELDRSPEQSSIKVGGSLFSDETIVSSLLKDIGLNG